MTGVKGEVSKLGTVGAFLNRRACSDTLFHVIQKAYGHTLKQEEQAVMPLAGGIMQHGYQCGMIWGAALSAGAQSYRLNGSGPKSETASILAAQKIVESFKAQNKHINCLEITEIDKSSSNMDMIVYFLLKGGTIGCFRRAATYAPVAYDEINAVFSDSTEEVPELPVSCSAELAKRMGVSEMQVVMAAGLAGGIGLCGGACGALGAAVWIRIMQRMNEPGVKLDFKDPEATKIIDRFIKQTDYRFECSEITGKTFTDVNDHAEYVKSGGCLELIDILAQ